MDRVYKTVHKYGKDEIIINKSRFIGHSIPINTEDEAMEIINKLKSEYYDATHNVYAYVLGKDNNKQKFNDDGEPSGTAGLPVLEVIKKEDLRNVLVVVTRYFGGIKLGGGGLIRAYTKGAKIGLEAGLIIDRVLHKKLKLRINYSAYGAVENYLNNGMYIIDNTIYDDAVNIYVYVNVSEVDSFIHHIKGLTSGDVVVDDLADQYISMKDNKRVL